MRLEPYPPWTWNTLWRSWLVSTVALVLTDGTWQLAGGDWTVVPLWLEVVNAFVLNVAYWSWRARVVTEREQAVSEQDPG